MPSKALRLSSTHRVNLLLCADAAEEAEVAASLARLEAWSATVGAIVCNAGLIDRSRAANEISTSNLSITMRDASKMYFSCAYVLL